MNQEDVIHNLQNITTKYQEILSAMMNHKFPGNITPMICKDKMQLIVSSIITKMQEKPEQFARLNMEYSEQFSALLINTFMKFIGESVPSMFTPQKGDKRFKDEAWNENIYFDFIKQFYLMSSTLVRKHVSSLGLEPQTQRMTDFLANQFTNAFCPSNFLFSNPEVLRESANSGWKNIAQGMDNFIQDLKNSDNLFDIQTTDKMFFKLGNNIASTPGKIVMQNELMQLIAYEPKSKMHSIPILIVPPCINKYYILDLSPENSLVKWLVDNNFQVFMVSWVNPDKHLSDMDLEDYIKLGVLDTTEYICQNLDYKKVSCIGYCIGGTILAAAMSLLEAKGNSRIDSSAFLATLLDFSDPGDIGLFVNNDTLNALKEDIDHKGYFDGKYLAHSFSLLRANDLIWSFFVNNYLLGKRPLPFDILYWNSDPTNLPAKMFYTYMEKFYIKNQLVIPNEISILGEKISLKNIKSPSFFLACREDHITLWKPIFKGMQAVGGNKTLCVATSGHVAGIVNPPSHRKYSYFINGDISSTPEQFMDTAIEVKGSWWSCWLEWWKDKSSNNELVEEKKYAFLNTISPAPGEYVKVRI
ncbi:MAG: Poly(3-hydroxyalkanoate) synthetase [Pseudomonadota bacterium]|jgi:polyhydroxyalkanoate synthase